MSPSSRAKTGNPSRQYLIMVIDDHPVICRGVVELVKAQEGFDVCCEASDLDAAQRQLKEFHPDLIILDLMLHGHNALSFLRELKDGPNPPKVLILTLHPEEIYGERAIAAGADGYINKEEASDDIVRAVRTVLAGDRYFSDKLKERIEAGPASASAGSTYDLTQYLTGRELEVFELIGDGLSTKQIGHKLGISAKTVETHESRLRDKLSVNNRLELSRRAILWRADQS